MGWKLFPMLVLALFAGIFAINRTQLLANGPDYKATQSNWSGQEFVRYRDAVSAFMQSNQTFTGTINSTMLASQGTKFSAGFLSLVGNSVSVIGSNGRVITCYGKLPTGALGVALEVTQGDASLGVASSGYWTSAAPGLNTTPQLLATSVPDGYVVSVLQIGG